LPPEFGTLVQGVIDHDEPRIAAPEAEIAALKKTPRNSSLPPSSEHPHASPTPDKPAVVAGRSIFRARTLQLTCGVASMMAMPFR
jgi:hypothetical protein